MAIVLMSGGIDSSVVCKLLRKNGENVIPLFINYGQVSYQREWTACCYLCKKLELDKPVKVDLEGYGKVIPSDLTFGGKKEDNKAFVPGRNMLFLSVAASYAYVRNETIIAIGLIKGDGLPDQTQEFIVNANFALNSALGRNLTIVTPLIEFSKTQVILLAKKYQIPLDMTYSCYGGKEKYCGKCATCIEILNSGEAKEFTQFKGDENGGRG